MKYQLKLFITGLSFPSRRAVAQLEKIRACAKSLGVELEVEVIDVLDSPEEAEKEKIVATPTLIKKIPLPLRKLIGDLSDIDQVIAAIDLRGDHLER